MNKHTGLTDKEVLESRKLYGTNELTVKRQNQFIKTIKSIYKEPMFVLLIFCVILYLFLGEPLDASILSLMVVLIITIQIYQEKKTDKTLEALKQLSNPISNVLRNGITIRIPSSEIVIGDILILNEGDKISADALIIESHNLNVDESTLTGEVYPVLKSVNNINKDDYFKNNYVYASTLVTKGNALVQVTSIGNNTENGKISKNLAKIQKNNSPLQKSISRLVKAFGISSVISFLLVIIIITIKINFKEGLLAGLTIAMSVIPEEFPVVLTVFLTMGTYKIAKKQAIIRKLPAVETLGSITYLCVDKTGTITKNKMEVNEIYSLIDEKKFLYNSLLASEELVYDPLENAIKEYSKENNVVEVYNNKKLLKKYPFSSENKMAGNIYEEDGKKTLYVKGAIESLFDICKLNVEEKYSIHKKQKEMSKKGLRVIGVCSNNIEKISDELYDYELNFEGLIGLYDPPKENVDKDIKLAQTAGIKVIMITGDNKETASAIAKQIGLDNYNHVIVGKELDVLSDDELKEKIKRVGVFARVIPEHKLRIVTILQSLGEVVGMTGDGVNDATSLKKADIGISMGKRGTEVAKEASDMILLDDNFSTIIKAIEGAREIYINIKKSVNYILAMHIPMILLALLVPLFNLPIFLLPVHVVIIEMITDPTCSIIFERQKIGKSIMNLPPRKKDERLINIQNILSCIIRGTIIFLFVFVSYSMLKDNKLVAMSFSFGMLIISSILLAYSILFENSNSKISIIKDKVILFINIGIVLFVIGTIYLPFLNKIVRTAPINIYMFILMIFLSFISVFWFNLFNRNKKTL